MVLMFVALSQFTIANGMSEQVKRAFRQRPHLVDSAPGFVRLDVISPTDDADEIWLITYWKDESSYRTWHRGHGFLSTVGIHHVSQGSRAGA